MAKKKGSSTAADSVVEVTIPEGFGTFITPIAVVLSAILVSVSIIYAAGKISEGGVALGESTENDDAAQEETDTAQEEVYEVPEMTLTDLGSFETFTEYENDICTQDGKPVVYLFSTTWCPHCEWILETFDNWAKENSDRVVAYHWELDTMDNTLTDEVETEVPSEMEEVYNTFNPGGSIPTFVFGCRYSRVGNGYEAEDDLQKEVESFDKVLGELEGKI